MEKTEETEKNEKEALLREVQRLLESGIYGEVTRTKTTAVIGVGGAGGNSLQRLHKMGLKSMKNVESIAINSDERVLDLLKDVDKRVLIGKNLFEHPRGAHGRIDIARKMVNAARESLEVLVNPYPVLLLIGALGGGTGSELMVELSRIGVRKGKLVIAIPIMPFSTETGRRNLAKAIMRRLKSTGAVIAPLDNDTLLRDERMKGMGIDRAFETLDRVIFRKIKEVQDESMKTVINEIARDVMNRISTAYGETAPMPEMGPSYAPMSPPVNPVTARTESLMKADNEQKDGKPEAPQPEDLPNIGNQPT